MPNPQSAGRGRGGGEVAGLSTLFADQTIVIPSAGVFSHLTDFVAKANSYCCSFHVHFPMPVVKVQYYVISTRSVGTSNASVLNVRTLLNFNIWHWVVHVE